MHIGEFDNSNKIAYLFTLTQQSYLQEITLKIHLQEAEYTHKKFRYWKLPKFSNTGNLFKINYVTCTQWSNTLLCKGMGELSLSSYGVISRMRCSVKKARCKRIYTVCYLLCKKGGDIGKHACVCWFLQKKETQERKTRKNRIGYPWGMGSRRSEQDMDTSDSLLSTLFCVDLAFGSILIFYLIKNKIKSPRMEGSKN